MNASAAAEPLTGRLAEALALAIEAHAEQTRKGTDIPYVAHLLAVCALVLEMGGDEQEAIAAILHDTIEDTTDNMADVAERIRGGFGDDVLEMVMAVSEPQQDDAGAARSWHERKRSYLEHVPSYGRGPVRIALADKLHNARSTWRVPATTRWERFNKTATIEDQAWWYRSLAEAFAAHAERDPQLEPFVGELRLVVDEICRGR